MKKIISIVIALGCFTLLNAFKANPLSYSIKVNEEYNKILVGENIKVVLTADETEKVSVSKANQIQLTVVEKVLTVKKLVNADAGIITVNIPVRKIKSMVLNEGASVYSKEQLMLDRLIIYVKDNSHFELRSKGIIKVVGVHAYKL